MSISSVSSAAPQLQALLAIQSQQPKEGTRPPAAKALDDSNAQMAATLASVSSGLDISA